MPLSVLFISKPVAPPFHDGAKCLVRDVARHLERTRAAVLTVPGAPAVEVNGAPPVERVPAYRSSGAFSPSLSENARAAAWVLLRSRADLWHFVFAPNPRTSAAGRWMRRLRRVPVVQTVASPPREFDPSVFFGDVVVAQSRWTRERIHRAFREAGREPPRVEVVPPPVADVERRGAEAMARVCRDLGIVEGAPVFVYPGDLEVSRGAETVAAAVEPIVRALPEAVVVFACRAKTERAPEIERELAARLDARHVRFTREVDLPALLQLARAVLFPVDDLWGKVDLPISLLEAMVLGVPVVALQEGPLCDLEGACLLPALSAEALAEAAIRMATRREERESVVRAQQDAVERTFSARRVAQAYERLYGELGASR